MSLSDLISNMAKDRIERKARQQRLPERTRAPLNLHQETAVEFDATYLPLAQADGSLIRELDTTQFVVAVGTMQVFGKTVYRSYLSDGKSFIETVTSPLNSSPIHAASLASEQTRYYNLFMEMSPATAEEWDFFLNDELGFVGFPSFQVPNAQGEQVPYPRVWNPGPTRIRPVEVVETVMSGNGSASYVKHRLMQYSRRLGGHDTSGTEFLLADVADDNNGASVNLFMGLPLAEHDIKIFASSLNG